MKKLGKRTLALFIAVLLCVSLMPITANAALISGETFTINVVKVVNGNEVDSVTLTKKCLQSTGHSGYVHSTNLRNLANSSGFSGYKGYKLSDYPTVPSTYTAGLCPDNNYSSVHYNITGSAPYTAKETLFLFFETAKTYTLNYNANGGSGAPGSQSATSTDSSYNFAISSTKPTRNGFEFLGWSTNDKATSPSYNAGGKINVTGTTTLYAVWKQAETPKNYTYQLTWDYNGGMIGSNATATKTETRQSDTYTFYEDAPGYGYPKPTRNGYKFTGWSYSGNGEFVVSNGQINMTGTAGSTVSGTLTAQWKQTSATYKVEWYDIEGNVIKAPETREGTVGKPVSVTDDDKSVEGYTFDADNEGNVLSDTLAASGTVLRLYFTKDQPTPPVDNGAGISIEKIRTSADTAKVGDTITWEILVENLSNVEKTVTLTELPDVELSESTFTLDAGESKTVTATYEVQESDVGKKFLNTVKASTDVEGEDCEDTDEGTDIVEDSETPDTITVTWKDGYTDTPIKVMTIDRDGDYSELYPTDPTREDFEFTGWGEPETDEEGNITITAQWEPVGEETKTITVTWVDENGTTILDGPKSFKTDEEEPPYSKELPTKPEDENNTYTFKEWEKSVDTDGNITYKAVYSPTPKKPVTPTPTPSTPPTPVIPTPPTPPATTYTVRYTDGVEDEVVFTDKTFSGLSYGVATPEFGEDPQREGYTFLGWEPEVAPTVTGSVTYVAQWEEDEEIEEPDVPLIVAPGLDAVNHFAYIIGYGDGTVRPTRNITRAEVATIFYRLMTDDFRGTFWSQTNDFTDVDASKWFNNAVSTSAEAELVKGYADGTFRGNNNITRAEFATIAARFLSDDPVGENPFTDTQGHWAERDILKAYEAGWINGYADGSFQPNALITRAEAMTIVNRMLNRVPHAEDLHEDMVTYPDNNLGDWYYAAVQEATNSHDYEMGDRDGETVETWTAMKANRNWAALEKEWSNAYSGSNGNDVM